MYPTIFGSIPLSLKVTDKNASKNEEYVDPTKHKIIANNECLFKNKDLSEILFGYYLQSLSKSSTFSKLTRISSIFSIETDLFKTEGVIIIQTTKPIALITPNKYIV